MNLDLSQEQEILRSSLRRLCQAEVTNEVVRRAEVDCGVIRDAVWPTLARSGFLGLRIDQRWGGAGLGMLETSLAYHEFGRVLLPGPHFESAILVAALIERSGTVDQKLRWLPGIGDGSLVFTPAWSEPGGDEDLATVNVTPRPEGEVLRLTGRKQIVAHAGSADRLLVLARDPVVTERHVLLCVDASATGVDIRAEPNLASAPLCTVDFHDVKVCPGDCLDFGQGGISASWDRTFIECLVPLAAQAVGGAERVLELSVEYAKQRVQFDRSIGSFQSIAHDLSEAATELEAARVLVWQAACAIDEALPFERLAITAKLFACRAFRRISALAIQIHGGLGFTIEAEPQLYFRRAKYQQLIHGEPSWLEKRLASLVIAGDVPTLV